MVSLRVNRPHGRGLHDVTDPEVVREALREDARLEAGPQCVQLIPEPCPEGQGALLVGVHGDRGTLWWSNPRKGESVVITGGANTDVVRYGYDTDIVDFPPGVELPLATVVDAAAEFTRTGERPGAVSWIDVDDAWDAYDAQRDKPDPISITATLDDGITLDVSDPTSLTVSLSQHLGKDYVTAHIVGDDSELIVGFRGDKGVCYWRSAGAPDVVSAGGSNQEPESYGLNEIPMPPHSEVSATATMIAVQQFASTGYRPTIVEWTEYRAAMGTVRT